MTDELLADAEAIRDRAEELLADVKRGRDSISLNEADRIAPVVREARGWLLSVLRCLE